MSDTGWAGGSKGGPTNIDPLLAPLLPPGSDDPAGKTLSNLIATHARPVIESVIRYKLHLPFHRTTGQADADDLRQEAVVQLLTKLQKFREEPAGHPIVDVRGLAAVIAHRTCSRWMRRQFPKRHALKNRLHYLLTRGDGFALWQGENKKLIAGYAAWKGRKNLATEERFKRLLDDDGLLPQIMLLKIKRGPGELNGVLAAIFNHLGSPIEFDRLVRALVELLQIEDQPMETTGHSEDVLRMAAAGEPDAAWQAEKRIFLQRLWQEVCQLPLHQRMALLLNLRDPDGSGCIALFPAMGIATLRQLSEALEMSVEKLAGLWNDLPLEDSRIAELLQLTRQQVINARKSARERLTRKLRGFV